MGYKTFPILTVARKSGLPVEDRGLRQVHINCPFCGDRRRRLYLYTDTNPVSYTHLDVYKRQAVRGAKSDFSARAMTI